jgi:uncharacterized protein (TIGR02147 family)
MIELADAALKKLPREQRDFSTATLSIDKDSFVQITECCNRFRKEILSIASRVETPDRILQVNIQCFPVSKVETGTDDLGAGSIICTDNGATR